MQLSDLRTAHYFYATIVVVGLIAVNATRPWGLTAPANGIGVVVAQERVQPGLFGPRSTTETHIRVLADARYEWAKSGELWKEYDPTCFFDVAVGDTVRIHWTFTRPRWRCP